MGKWGTWIAVGIAFILIRRRMSPALSGLGGELIPGGLAEGRKPSEFDPDQLAQGVLVEMEHTRDPLVAREIAMDHLSEDPLYYDHLKLIHR